MIRNTRCSKNISQGCKQKTTTKPTTELEKLKGFNLNLRGSKGDNSPIYLVIRYKGKKLVYPIEVFLRYFLYSFQTNTFSFNGTTNTGQVFTAFIILFTFLSWYISVFESLPSFPINIISISNFSTAS